MRRIIKALAEGLDIGRRKPRDPDTHLAAAAEWLARAQDATADDGVSASYDIKAGEWSASYPETTGYIITTLYDYAAYSGNREFAERAERMARWESEIQLDEGGVLAGTMDADIKAPTIFNTGQVLFGWARAYEETRDPVFADSLTKASDWLVKVQDDDGAWRRHASPFASHEVNTYNTRVAFGLVRAWEVLGRQEWLDAAVKNVDWVARRAHGNGWMPDNCLTDNSRPLTHTIAYAVRGILEVGVAADRDDFIDLAVLAAENVAAAQRRDGALPGRLDSEWQPAARWSCLTGNSQMALNWQRIDEVAGNARLAKAAREANAYNMSVQSLDDADDGLRGGIQGSYPVYGEYMRWRVPNWAAKFFMDSLMLENGFPVDRTADSRTG